LYLAPKELDKDSDLSGCRLRSLSGREKSDSELTSKAIKVSRFIPLAGMVFGLNLKANVLVVLQRVKLGAVRHRLTYYLKQQDNNDYLRGK